MALAATQMALKDAAFDPAQGQPYKMSVITASSSGGNEFGQREIQNLWGKGPIFVGAYQSIAWFYAATTGQISIKYGMKGPCGVVISEGAGGLDALALARRNIRRQTDVAISGGAEAPLTPYAITCLTRNDYVSRSADQHASTLRLTPKPAVTCPAKAPLSAYRVRARASAKHPHLWRDCRLRRRTTPITIASQPDHQLLRARDGTGAQKCGNSARRGGRHLRGRGWNAGFGCARGARDSSGFRRSLLVFQSPRPVHGGSAVCRWRGS